MNDHDRDRSCLERLRSGDSAALEELYDRHSDLLYSLAIRIVGSAAEAEEVLQDTWLQAWRRSATFDPGRGTVGAWLVTIARSRALDRLRSLGSRQRAERAAGVEIVAAADGGTPTDASAETGSQQLGEHVARAMGALEPRHREVIELAYFSGLSQSEIATRLDTPLGTIKSWTRQALQRLRERVPQEELS